MRPVALVVALAACGHPKPTGPKWPEPSATAEDGGESISPRPSATYAAAIEKSSDDADNKPVGSPTATPASSSPGDDKPAATPAATTPANDDVFMSEEIIIEIDD
jgi:hypothetical protein